MSVHMKLILPMINESLSLDDISENSGFIDAYSIDINKPGITNCIFLLYKKSMTQQAIATDKKLSSLPELYNKRNIKINDQFYTLYGFVINKNIRFIMNNATLMLGDSCKRQIGNFWKFTDSDVTDYLLGYYYFKKFEDNYVPEEDFSPIDFIAYEKGEAFEMNASPLLFCTICLQF